MQIGIVGLPNVGKSTLFNALTKSYAAEAANFPFCTIEPKTALACVGAVLVLHRLGNEFVRGHNPNGFQALGVENKPIVMADLVSYSGK